MNFKILSMNDAQKHFCTELPISEKGQQFEI